LKRNQKVQALVQKQEKFIRNGFPPLLPKNENQKKFLEALKYDTIVIAEGSAGTGKAQPLSSKILTKGGWKTIGEITVGDFVHSVDGWVNVTGVFPQGKKQVVRFRFKDGAEVESCTEHLWTVFNSAHKSTATLDTLTSQEIIDLLESKKSLKRARNISVPSSPVVDFENTVKLPIPPYVLGVLIGDGSITQSTPTVTSIDSEIFSHVLNEMSKVGEGFAFTDTLSITKSISDSESTWQKPNRLTTALKFLGLHGKDSYTKFIPEIYKTSSIEERYSLLQGLMDTDGTCSKPTGGVVFSSSSKQLAEDVREIVLSLGGKASISTKIPVYTHKGVKVKGALHYIVSLNVIDKRKLFRLERKKVLVSNTDQSQLRRVIESYEIVGEKECQCISVNHPSRLYVTDGYVLTHNTMVSCWHAAKKLFYGDVKKIVLIRAYQPLAGRTIGFMPGTAEEKLKPYYQQMLDYLEDFLGKGAVEVGLKSGSIEMCSLETIRGRSWNNTIALIDESQSLFVPEVQALTTRLGEGSQMIFCGDNSGLQTDVKNTMDGLTYLHKLVDKYKIPEVSSIQFTREDICRSDITKSFVIAFEDEVLAESEGKSIISRTEIDKQFKKGR
jgi:phosphate starvation-inducible protein PhoH